MVRFCVTYVHFLFDRHQIMESDGAETESLFTGPEALKTVDSAARIEILHLFPELASIDYDRLPDPVRPIFVGTSGTQACKSPCEQQKAFGAVMFRTNKQGAVHLGAPFLWITSIFCG